MASKSSASGVSKADAKRVLVVLFIPSVERDGKTAVDQDHWKGEALKLFGGLFGGATAYPKATGVWRDDERGGVLVFDEPIVLHCYTTPKLVKNTANLASLREFCEKMGKATNQGEIGLVIDSEYIAITDY